VLATAVFGSSISMPACPDGTGHCSNFLLVGNRRERPAVAAFLKALADPAVRTRISALGMTPV